ncbi:MAG: hypothetical protein HW380_656 [Magnetococcales bacterium]|nr:hypothetical protein [Magnetococcales bacterium]HIJ85381.1 hypothetical protein [Magnetococcales bacterium]
MINSDSLPVATIPLMGAATAGAAGTPGIVPAPAAGDHTRVLTGGATYLSLGDLATKKSNLSASSAPTATSDLSAGYDVGSVWIDLVANISYICVDSTTGSAIWDRRGQDGQPGQPIVHRGEWNSGAAYITGDGVTRLGSSYFCITGNTNQAPPNATYWGILAIKGDTGTAGTGIETVVPITSSAGAVVLSLASGTAFTTSLIENITSITVSNVPGAAITATWHVTQHASAAKSIILPTGFVWATGTSPDFASLGAKYILTFKTIDSGTSGVELVFRRRSL